VAEKERLDDSSSEETTPFRLKDLVQIRIPGTGLVEGPIVAITAKRIHVKPAGFTTPLQRTPKNVTLLAHNGER
jgi:hypothetical protein